jgi:2-amino-4-hydroxy-6-hydroxymethyldihydropteridine diphosphokinase
MARTGREVDDAGVGGESRKAQSNLFLGLGANLGDRIGQLRSAIARLRDFVEIDAISSVYLTEPVGVRSQPEFANLVLLGRTGEDVRAVLRRTQEIELEMGRTTGVRYGPRVIDIDILAFGDMVLSSEHLVVPHAWLHRRCFVLVPLVEIAPDWKHPVFSETAEAMLRKLTSRTAVRRAGPLDLATPASLPV